MLLAETEEGIRIPPHPGGKAICPCCKGEVIAKCGLEKMWHWAHVKKDCDMWHEPMGPWHEEWQGRFPEKYREVVIENHRADILYGGLVVELQSSSISLEKILEREAFYKKMIWVVNAETFGDKIQFTLQTKEDGSSYHTYQWKNGRKKWGECKCAVYLDLTLSRKFNHNKYLRRKRDKFDYGDDTQIIFLIKNMHRNDNNNRPVSGWGEFMTKEALLAKIGLPATNVIELPRPSKPSDANGKQLKLTLG